LCPKEDFRTLLIETVLAAREKTKTNVVKQAMVDFRNRNFNFSRKDLAEVKLVTTSTTFPVVNFQSVSLSLSYGCSAHFDPFVESGIV
jgi:hypothetical protein